MIDLDHAGVRHQLPRNRELVVGQFGALGIAETDPSYDLDGWDATVKVCALVTVLMGVFILGERLRPLQWLAVGVASAAVVVLTVEYGRLPWIAIALMSCFSRYSTRSSSMRASLRNA